jgi:short subunit dehydrogenase-like uncharacterized protein
VGNLLVYGSTGYTGNLIAHLAAKRGLNPILSGRNADKVTAQAADLGVDARPFQLDDQSAIVDSLADVSVVLHCAGPYIHTYAPMVAACLQVGAHYLDLTGEIPVYQAIARLDEAARARNVMLLPGAGFDVVPTDCLAAYLKSRLPEASHLTLAFFMVGPARTSRGTSKSTVEMLPQGGMVRRNGELVRVPLGVATRQIDFGRGPVKSLQIPWGDVFTAWYSTGIPNIETYIGLPGVPQMALTGLRVLHPMLALQGVRSLLKAIIDRQPAGPTADQRARSSTIVWGEITDPYGGKAVARLYGPEGGYTWTPMIALTIAERALAGDAPSGYQTPARAYGPDFILETGNVTREDVL